MFPPPIRTRRGVPVRAVHRVTYASMARGTTQQTRVEVSFGLELHLPWPTPPSAGSEADWTVTRAAGTGR